MDIVGHRNVEDITNTALAVEESEPSKSQHPKVRGCTNSSRSKSVLVYDGDEKTVQVQSEKAVREQINSTVHVPS